MQLNYLYRAWLLGCLLLSGTALASAEAEPPANSPAWQLVESHAHHDAIFTQGLELHGNRLYESSGLYQKSFLQHVPYPAPDRATGPNGEMHPRYRVAGEVPRNRFAEGLTVLNDELYLLTWRSGDLFLYNPETLKPRGQLKIYGEGWGLTNDGQSLIMSNGTPELRWLNPRNGKIRRRLTVKYPDGSEQYDLNELEYINGEIFANVWQRDEIVRIDPATGIVLQKLDLAALWPRQRRPASANVLNGITWDPRSDSLLVTGKRWPALYRLKLRDMPGSLLVTSPAANSGSQR